MNLGKAYKKAKKGKSVLSKQFAYIAVTVGMTLALLYPINLLWNYVVPTFGLPELNYLRFIGAAFLLSLIKTHFFTSKEVGRDDSGDNLVQLLKGFPENGQQ